MKKAALVAVLLFAAVAGFLAGRFAVPPAVLPAIKAPVVIENQPSMPVPPTTARPTEPTATEPTADVVVETPAEGATLDGTFDVTGRARVDIGELAIAVKDATGSTVTEARADIASDDSGSAFGRFSQSVSVPPTLIGAATIEISYVSGEPVIADTRHVIFAEQDSVPIRVFFGTAAGSESNTDCSVLDSVGRVVSSKGSIYEMAIGELLKGPTDAEKAAGYFTSLPNGVTLKSVAADASGVVTADFSASLDRGVAGSCRVTAIRAQITQTLKQFPEVRDVVVSVNGQTEGILQP